MKESREETGESTIKHPVSHTHPFSLSLSLSHPLPTFSWCVSHDLASRWYNRLLGRNQNDPQVVVRRRRANQANRPNIGRALVGLARDRPAEPGRPEQAEEITWARLLGLDGTYRFLEHVVWLIFLVSALIISFIFVPYQIGRLAAAITSLWDLLGIVTWKGAIATFIGYIIVCCIIIAFYYGMGWIKLPRVRSILGVTYVAIKVGMILAVEAGVFPLMCGWWIDICALSLFGSTMSARQDSLRRAPGTVTFLHWLAGMIFIFYLASFVMLLREVLRPGVLWFLRNLNDQNFHPVQEMIGLPMQRHLRRFIMSCLMFGVCVMFALLIPNRVVSFLFPSFLPLNLTLASSISPIREIQLELILLQFVVPTLLEHGNSRAGLKFIIKHWANLSAALFGLQSYLLDKPQTGGDVIDIHENVLLHIPAEPNPDNPAPNGPVYDGIQVLGPGFAPFKPYLRPRFFYVRVVGFLVFTALVAISASVASITLPVSVGRLLMSLVGVTQAPDIYTAAIGLYTVWLFFRVAGTLMQYTSQGVSTLTKQISVWALQGVKCVVVGFLLLVVIPLLLGHVVDLVIITPLRVPSDRTPLFYPSTEWALGLLHAKCICGAIWLTNIRFKHTLDQVYQAGVRNLDLTFVCKSVAWPVIVILSLAITLPYITFMGLAPLTGLPYEQCLLVYRYFFPTLLAVLVVAALVLLVVRQVNKLYENVKNERYLVGRQLVNYMTTPEETGVTIVEDSDPVQESGQQ
jgi:E3 ubiquitin-protein ligase MARCH6